VDHVVSYVGHQFEKKTRDDNMANITLYGINELARSNRLVLCKRQRSNRDFRILIKNDEYESQSKDNFYRNNFSKLNSYRSEMDSACTFDESLRSKNYKKFLYNFNKLATACYLKVLKAKDNLYSKYNVSTSLEKDTNFYVIESSPTVNEHELRLLLEDDEFVENYSHLIFELHNKVASQLNKNLNKTLPVNKSFYENLSSGSSIFTESTEGSSLPRDSPFSDFGYSKSATKIKKPQSENDVHLFRSFRIIGLRHPITTTATKTINTSRASSSKYSKLSTNDDQTLSSKNRLKVEPVSEIVEIRCSFDIKQFDNRSKYDCFIECELSYYKVQPESVAAKKRPSNIYNHCSLESTHQNQQQKNSQQRYNHTNKCETHRNNTDSQYFNFLDANLTNSTNKFIKHLRLSVSSDDIYDYPSNGRVFKKNDAKIK